MHIIVLFALMMFTSMPIIANQAPWVGVDLKNSNCTGGGQGYGPFDYTNPEHKDKIPVVEEHHLTFNVENHIKGQEGSIPSDLDYVLRAIPNHHRGLLSMIRYELKLHNKLTQEPIPLLTRPECYLQRAINFSPNDASSYALYGYYLYKLGNLEKAVKYYERALVIQPNNSKIAYSFSLLLIDLKRYNEAMKQAKIAYKNKQAPQKLKQKLVKLGVWTE